MGIFSRLFGGNGPEGDGGERETGSDQHSDRPGAPVLATAAAGAAVSPTFAATTTAPAPTPTLPREASVTDDPPAPRSRAPLPKLPKRAAPPPAAATSEPASIPAPAPAPVATPPAAPTPPVVTAPTTPVVISPRSTSRKLPIVTPNPARAATMQAVVPPPPAQPAVAAAPPPPAPAPVAATPAPTPTPAHAPAPAPPAQAAVPMHVPVERTPREPIPPAPIPRWSGATERRSKSISEAFDFSTTDQSAPTAPAPSGAGVSTAEDLAAVRGVFNEVAAVHVSQVRDIMLEVRYGDANPVWIESTKPALRSLRAMAGQMELVDLVEALDQFCAAVDAAVANRMNDDDKLELMRRYERLIELIPNAFALDVERDRREPIIIDALLSQVEGVERPTIEKLSAVGLNRLDALIATNVDDLVAIASLRRPLADAIVAHFRTYRATAQSMMSAPDPVSEKKQLHDLVIVMSLQNDEFNRAASGWTDEARATKRTLRKQREQTFQKIKVALARLGERDQLSRLERLPFNERIATLDRYLSSQPRT